MCEGTNSQRVQIDVQDLDISLIRRASGEEGPSRASKTSKAKSEGLELLSHAHLRIKPGARLALIGRNGTGKSTLLKAISERLIPALPGNLRVAAMRQVQDELEMGEQRAYLPDVKEATVREFVGRSDGWRNRLEGELEGMDGLELEPRDVDILLMRDRDH